MPVSESQDETFARVLRFSKLLDCCGRCSEAGRQAVVNVDDGSQFFRSGIGPGIIYPSFNEYAEIEEIPAQSFVHGMIGFCQFGLKYGPYPLIVFERFFQIGAAGLRIPVLLTSL